ncbi:MAG: formylmethanofuran dehydrogenase subunit C [Thermoleophilia bacterium]
MGCLSCAALARTRGEVTLRRRESSTIPVEADSISPDRFQGLSEEEIRRLPAFYGRRRVTLGDLFEIEGVNPDQIGVEGDLRHVKKIGYGMTRGTLTVRGDAGPHLGAYMSGGEITVDGSAGDWAGAHMSGGVLNIMEDAANFLGGAYPGETRGMKGGLIVVRGDVGREAGLKMRRGLIAVLGSTADFPGSHMVAGTLMVFGRLGERPGAGMKRGSIVAFGEVPDLLPSFRYSGAWDPAFLRFYVHYLVKEGLMLSERKLAGNYRRYVGDFNELGKGEILFHDQRE